MRPSSALTDLRTGGRLGAFAAGVALLATGAYGLGSAVGPVGAEPSAHAAHDTAPPGTASHSPSSTAEVEVPGGLQISQGGYTLEPTGSTYEVGDAQDFSFRVLGPDGEAVTAFTPTHDKALHLIVVRRDLTGFQHVHPRLAPDGSWSVPLTFDAAGTYRVFADFRPAALDEGLTLGADVDVAGPFEARALPEPDRTAEVDDYTVTLAGDLVPGQVSELTLSVARDGRPVTDLQPYLAAYGHLVALRDGDLAYLHVHPDGAPGDGTTPAGPDVTFYAQVPSAGSYRLFLDFQHDDVVRTASFTARATGTAGHGGTGTHGH